MGAAGAKGLKRARDLARPRSGGALLPNNQPGRPLADEVGDEDESYEDTELAASETSASAAGQSSAPTSSVASVVHFPRPGSPNRALASNTPSSTVRRSETKSARHSSRSRTPHHGVAPVSTTATVGDDFPRNAFVARLDLQPLETETDAGDLSEEESFLSQRAQSLITDEDYIYDEAFPPPEEIHVNEHVAESPAVSVSSRAFSAASTTLTFTPSFAQKELRGQPATSRVVVSLDSELQVIPWGDLDFGGPDDGALELGRGGNGVVHRAVYLGDYVAVKELRRGCSSTRQFMQEVMFLRSLRHPHCVLFMGLAVFPSRDCIERVGVVTEYMEDGDLGDYLRAAARRGGLSLVDGVRTMLDVAKGLQYLHAQGHPHRDVKPGNILMNRGVAKLSDFELSCVSTDANVHKLSRSYCSPEQLMATVRFATMACDVYAFAVVGYEVFTLRRAFPSSRATLQAPTFDTSWELPEELSALLTGCWHKDPKARPSMLEVVRELKSIKVHSRTSQLKSFASFSSYATEALDT